MVWASSKGSKKQEILYVGKYMDIALITENKMEKQMENEMETRYLCPKL